MNTNKTCGNRFEADLCNRLASHGFWAHNMAQRRDGQPADVIAVRNGKAYLIDCKACALAYFDLSRIEENQRLAMTVWEARGNGCGWFALKAEDEIYMISFGEIQEMQVANKSRIIREHIVQLPTLREWVKKCE